MASSKEYLDFIMDQLSSLDGVSYRAMMGEYVIYYGGRVIGGVYDDRFLVKQTATSKRMMEDAPLEIPYPGGSPMLLVEDVDDRGFLEELFRSMVSELPEPKKRGAKAGGNK